MNDEALNMSIRKFLKTVGVNSQLAIEKAVQKSDRGGEAEGQRGLSRRHDALGREAQYRHQVRWRDKAGVTALPRMNRRHFDSARVTLPHAQSLALTHCGLLQGLQDQLLPALRHLQPLQEIHAEQHLPGLEPFGYHRGHVTHLDSRQAHAVEARRIAGRRARRRLQGDRRPQLQLELARDLRRQRDVGGAGVEQKGRPAGRSLRRLRESARRGCAAIPLPRRVPRRARGWDSPRARPIHRPPTTRCR